VNQTAGIARLLYRSKALIAHLRRLGHPRFGFAVENLKEEVTRAHRNASTLRDDLARAQEELAQTQRNASTLRDDLARAQEELAQTSKELARTSEEMSTLRRVLDAIPSLGHELSALKSQVAPLVTASSGLATSFNGDFFERADLRSMRRYWNDHNVSAHRSFVDAQESSAYLDYRNKSYPGYLSLMPFDQQQGKVVLDYGCGPGNDLVGFVTHSHPERLIGMDISETSLTEARARLSLHGASAELTHIPWGTYEIPLPSQSVDYIHCSGVLMLIEDPVATLTEFKRILKSGGEIRLMVYNYSSVWVHLYVAYMLQVRNGLYRSRTLREAFARTTDGEYCPVVHVWSRDDMDRLAGEAGLHATFLGAALSLWELYLLPRRFEAALDERLGPESRNFLLDLTFDESGQPWYKGAQAGIDGCYSLRDG
jgi:ubiquinone/menaquinone biosynthesis C-methylase UbiE